MLPQHAAGTMGVWGQIPGAGAWGSLLASRWARAACHPSGAGGLAEMGATERRSSGVCETERKQDGDLQRRLSDNVSPRPLFGPGPR